MNQQQLNDFFALDWAKRSIRQQYRSALVVDAKSLCACAEMGLRPHALLVCKPLLANSHLRALWQGPWTGVPALKVTPDRYRRYAGMGRARGLAAVMPMRLLPITVLAQRPGLWLAVRHIRSHGNVGTLVRSAHALGVQGLMLIGGTIDVFDPRVQRASMGAVWRLPVVQTGHDVMRRWSLGHPCWQVLGATPGGLLTPREVDWSRPSIVILGHERHGLSLEDQAVLTGTVRIPQVVGADSLNVGMCGTVFAFIGGHTHVSRGGSGFE